ncbi:hypothetical protein [Adhaeretor mobilis]|uniref:Uncharacterized protein n=1 Tax=Adhaeretor mobilis TaxID=1930276 RepID=A0A517MPF0_9BACT|nr:hypothetical protein [Adhaeretor mobilis]QDS96760.1 hypothetical protein HG15A2_00180 [Adhaeretor mobilis]
MEKSLIARRLALFPATIMADLREHVVSHRGTVFQSDALLSALARVLGGAA